MGSLTSEKEIRVSERFYDDYYYPDPETETLEFAAEEDELIEDTPLPLLNNKKTKKPKKNQVFLEGYYAEASEEDDLTRTKSLTDEDLEELKGCLDLGFGFSYEEIPDLCNTLPALELCYSMSQRFNLDDHQQQKSPELSPSPAETPSPIANWKISSPGDHPEDVKARLKYWAQTVACTVRLCS